MACCNTCKKQAAKVAGMKRTKNSSSQIIMTGLEVAGGFVLGKAAGAIPFVAANPMFRIVAPLGGAILMPMLLGKSATTANLSAGMITAAATSAVQEYAPGIATTVGLAGTPYKSTWLPGVGQGNGYSQMPKVVF